MKLTKLHLFLIIIAVLVASTLGFSIKEYFENKEADYNEALDKGTNYDPFGNNQSYDDSENNYDSTIADLEDIVIPGRRERRHHHDSNGNHIRNVKQNASNGSGKIAWNLRHKSYYPVRAGRAQSNWWFNPSGPYVTPGEYQAELYLENNGSVEKLDGPVSFNVKPLRKGTLEGSSYDDYNNFRNMVSSLYIEISKYEDEFNLMKAKVQLLEKASMELEDFSPEMIKKIADFKSKYNNVEYELDGNPARAEIGEWDKVTLAARIRIAMQGLSTSYGPTELNSSNLEIARKMFNESKGVIESLKAELESLENQIKELNPPHLAGSGIN